MKYDRLRRFARVPLFAPKTLHLSISTSTLIEPLSDARARNYLYSIYLLCPLDVHCIVAHRCAALCNFARYEESLAYRCIKLAAELISVETYFRYFCSRCLSRQEESTSRTRVPHRLHHD